MVYVFKDAMSQADQVCCRPNSG